MFLAAVVDLRLVDVVVSGDDLDGLRDIPVDIPQVRVGRDTLGMQRRRRR